MGESSELTTFESILNCVYIIRGQQIMLDHDLAQIYGYEVKNLNRQVKRNIARFPQDFMFQLTKEEYDNLRCQNVTANNNSMSRSLPYAFTEQGVYMLATVLKGELAEQQSIFIMRTFKEMRHFIVQNQQFVTQPEMKMLTARVSELSIQLTSIIDHQNKTDKDVESIQENITRLNNNFISNKDYKNFVIYKGQKLEADIAYIDIYQQAAKSIYVIDNYMNSKTLQLLSQKLSGVEVILFTENGHGRRGFLTTDIINDFENQYPPLKIKPNPDCHDRFIIIDYEASSEQVFHCGASSKDAGNKLCAINALSETSLIHPVIDKLLSLPDKTI